MEEAEMIKGVNKQIIEVNNTDSIYFERAVFYLRPGVRTLPSEVSCREIDRVLADCGVRAGRKRTSIKIGKLIICSLLLATIICVAILMIK